MSNELRIDRPIAQDQIPTYSRRVVLGWGGAAIGSFGLFLLGCNSSPRTVTSQTSNRDAEVEKYLQEYRVNEARLEPIIARFEEGYAKFAEASLPLLVKFTNNPAERTVLLNPFEIARINRGNPDRNLYTLKRKDLEARRVLSSGTTTTADPNFFFYELESPEMAGLNMVAAFSPVQRSFVVSETYNPDNILDNVIATHELIHAAQDNNDRQTLSPDVYYRFQTTPSRSGSRGKAVVLYEATAYAAEILLMNMHLDDELRRDVLANGEVLDVPKYRDRLHAKSDQDDLIRTLIKMANVIYKGKTTLAGVDEDFLHYVASMHRNNGQDVFDRTNNGFAPSRF